MPVWNLSGNRTENEDFCRKQWKSRAEFYQNIRKIQHSLWVRAQKLYSNTAASSFGHEFAQYQT